MFVAAADTIFIRHAVCPQPSRFPPAHRCSVDRGRIASRLRQTLRGRRSAGPPGVDGRQGRGGHPAAAKYRQYSGGDVPVGIQQFCVWATGHRSARRRRARFRQHERDSTRVCGGLDHPKFPPDRRVARGRQQSGRVGAAGLDHCCACRPQGKARRLRARDHLPILPDPDAAVRRRECRTGSLRSPMGSSTPGRFMGFRSSA